MKKTISYKNNYSYLVTILISLLAYLSSNTIYAKQESLKPILIISSYNPETSSTANNIAEFQRLCDSIGIRNQIHIENMNCKNLDEVSQWKERFRRYIKKYTINNKLNVAAIILLGQEAWSSFLSQDDEILDNIPIIANLISNNGAYLPHKDTTLENWIPESFNILDINKNNNIIATTYYYDIANNLNLISNLTPNINKIAFISDNTFGGVVMQSYIIKEFAKQNKYELILIDGRKLNFDGVLKKISEIDNQTAILIGSWRVDKDGTYFLNNNINQILPKNKNIPIYTISSIGVGYGAVGGIMPEYRNQGRDMANNLYNMLNGNLQQNTITAQNINNIAKFDAIKIDDLSLDKRLIKDAIIINKERGILAKYPSLINYLLVIFFGLVLYIIFISYHLLNTKKLIHSIKVSEHNNKLILNNIDIGLLYVNKDQDVVWENCSTNPDMHDWSFYKIGNKCDKYKPISDKADCLDCPIKNYNKTHLTIGRTIKKIINGNFYSISFIPTLDPYTQEYAGTIIRIENTTEDELANEQLKIAKEKAEKADKLKSLFLANMSHEIRTPLNAIVGFSDLMVNCDDKEERYEFSQIINSNNKLLLQLISDILDLSKIESGTLDFNYTNVNINYILDNIYNTFSQQVTQKGLELRVDKPNIKGVNITTDPLRLQQVLSNFITNALKFTQEGYIKIGYIDTTNKLKIYVRDTGIGISDDKLEVIFHRFVKLNSFAQGVGLGLSICSMIANRLKGSINVDSTIGKGSTFWIEIPKD